MATLTPGNLAFSSAQRWPNLGSEADHKLFQLSSQLQVTLEIDDLLNEFGNAVSQDMDYGSMGFINEEQDLQYFVGKKSRHACSYQLTINKDRLGLLWLTRSRKFSKTELEYLEHMLCALVYPLRNALKYQNALRAAFKDPLTGAENRAAMEDAVRREIDVARRHKRNLALIVMDVDYFKRINDRHGHTAGDSVLKMLADCAQQSIRCSDRLFRYGGEEFVALLPDTDLDGAKRLAERIRRQVAALNIEFSGKPVKITVSLGISTLEDQDDARTLFIQADEALYKAKANGRNQVVCSTD